MQKFTKQVHNVAKKLFFGALFMLICVGASAQARPNLITVTFSNEPLSEVLRTLEELDDYRFVFNYNETDGYNVTSTINGVDMRTALPRVLAGLPFEYDIEGVRITVKRLPGAAQPANTQEQNVSGRVTDQSGNPMIGVNVLVSGTTRGTITDVNGNYTLSVPVGSTLVFSYLGYQTQTIPVAGRATINVQMSVAEQMIGDVIVTGYQTISPERATGSFGIVDQTTLEKKPTSNIANALEGMIAGLQTVTSDINGQSRFLIRGQGTFQDEQVDRDPLIVVDGFPIQGFTSNNMGGDGFRNDRDPFSTINPNDVEKITVLKDAAATSIYGARAANGVIVITTKKGRQSDKLNVTVGGFVSVSSKPDLDYAYNMASSENTFFLMENLREYYPNYQKPWFNPYDDATDPFVFINDAARLLLEYHNMGNITEAEYNAQKAAMIGRGDQWKKDLNRLVYRNSVHQQYNVALRGGSEKINYSVSMSYDKDDAFQKGNGDQKIMFNSMNSFKLLKNLTLNIGLNASIANTKNNGVNTTTLKNTISPWSQLVDENGNYTHMASVISLPMASRSMSSSSGASLTTMYEPILRDKYASKVPVSWFYNPVEDQQHMNNTSERFNTRINAALEYNIIDGLKAAVSGQYERNQYSAHMVYGPESYYVRNYDNRYSTLNETTGLYQTYFPAGGIFNDRGDTYEGYNLRAQVDYFKTWNKHELVALVGSEVISSSQNNDPVLWRYGYNENTNSVLSSVDYVTKFKNIFGVEEYMPYLAPGNLISLEDRFFSVYANAAYTFDGKYTLSASARTDASNFQAKSVRDKFSPFWSVGAAWLISRENFMADVQWVDMLKLRASAGEAGFAAGKGVSSSVTTLGVNSGNVIYSNNEPYNTISARGNSTLTWEKSRSFDIGLEFRLWSGKLYGNFSYYNRYSYDVLSEASVPLITQGVSAATFNNASISNNGIELTLGTRMNITPDLTWDGSFNFSYNKNTVRKYDVINTSIRPSYYVGYPIGGIWTYKTAGYTPEGYIILKGKDGSEQAAVDYNSLHLYDSVNGAAGEKVEDYNWTYFLGSPTPTSYLGFSNTFSYKGLTLSFMLTGKFGYYFASGNAYGTRQDTPSYSKSLDEAVKVYKEGYANHKKYAGLPLWNEANKDVFAGGSTWMYMSNLVGVLENYYSRGDHIRLNEVYLGYELPGRLLGNQKVIRSINIYVQARNLGLLWSANGKMDPDYPIGDFKPMKTFTFGLKFNFN